VSNFLTAHQHILSYLVPYDKHNTTAMTMQDVTSAVAATPVSTMADVQMKELGDGDITTAMDLPRRGRTAASWLGRVCRRSLDAQIQASHPTVCAARKHVDKRPDFGRKCYSLMKLEFQSGMTAAKQKFALK